MTWRIYYSGGMVVNGATPLEWKDAPAEDVQVVVVLSPPPLVPPDRFRTGYVHCGRKDRTFYTGVDEYDPLGYGQPKFGSLLSDDDYFAIWDRAYGDN